MKKLPKNLISYKRTPEFNENTIPKGLLKAHQTKAGVWGEIVIIEGELQYTINEPEIETLILSKDHNGIVEPTIFHEVQALGKVRFYVDFYH